MLYSRAIGKTFYSAEKYVVSDRYQYVRLMSKTIRIVKSNGQWYQEEKESFGSAVQWSDEYLVTAKHVTFAKGSGYVSDICDLRFVRNKSGGGFPEWREKAPNESLKFIGASKTGGSLIVDGADADLTSRTVHNSGVDVCLATGNVEVGMSGGPIYARDGRVVGILSGFTSGFDVNGVIRKELLGYDCKIFPVYIPFSLIMQEWDRFKFEG